MRESLLDILMYVFDNYIDGEDPLELPHDMIETEMVGAGFHPGEVDKAINWFKTLKTLLENLKTMPAIHPDSVRIFSPIELQRISFEARRLLLNLEQMEIISAATREIVIDRAMALEDPIVDEADIKWVALMVLYNQPEQKEKLIFLEDMVLNNQDT